MSFEMNVTKTDSLISEPTPFTVELSEQCVQLLSNREALFVLRLLFLKLHDAMPRLPNKQKKGKKKGKKVGQ